MSVWAPRAATLPSGGWQVGVNLGVPGGIPTTRTQSGSTLATTGDNTDRTASIQALLNSAAPNTFVLLGAGEFHYNGTITVPDDVTLRGSGMDVTMMYPGNSGSIFLGSGSDYQWAFPSTTFGVTSGLSKGSQTLTVSDTTDFTVGNLVRMRMASNYNVPIVDVGGTGFSWMQMSRITGKTGTTLDIFPPCFDDYSQTQVYIATAQVYSAGSAIEDCTIDSTDSTYTITVWFQQMWGGWAKGVKFLQSANYCIQIQDSLQCEVTECYFGELQDGGSNKAGVLVNTGTGFYVYNNVFLNQQPNLETNSGSCAGVFAYNFISESESGIAVDTNHGPHNQFLLLEGNWMPHCLSDSYSGSQRYCHVFRNAITQITNGAESYSVSGKRWSIDFTIAGNIIGYPIISFTTDGLSFGQPNIGNDSSTGTAAQNSSSATLTTRSSSSSGTLTGQTGHGITTGQTLDYIVWNDNGSPPTARIRRNITVGTVSGNSIPFSGGDGVDLPSASSTVYIPTTNDAIRAYANQLNGSGSTIIGTLTTRTDDENGVITLSGTGTIATGSQASLYWSGGSRTYVVVGTVAGSTVPIGSDLITTGDVLPIVGTVITLWPGVSGFQELDLDVLSSADLAENYYTFSESVPPVEDIGSDTLPDSLYLSGTPSWFGALPFPPYGPEDPDFNPQATPAGVRYYADLPDEAPDIVTPCTVSGNPVEGQTLTAIPGGVTGNPFPTQTWKWQRDGVDIGGATSITYLLTGADVGHDVGPVQIETNGVGSPAESVATPLMISAFEGDQLVVTQVANASPVTELWLRGTLTNGVSAPLEYYLVQHSGPYPTQPDNNFVYARFGTPQDNVYVFQGTISEAEAIASVP